MWHPVDFPIAGSGVVITLPTGFVPTKKWTLRGESEFLKGSARLDFVWYKNAPAEILDLSTYDPVKGRRSQRFLGAYQLGHYIGQMTFLAPKLTGHWIWLDASVVYGKNVISVQYEDRKGNLTDALETLRFVMAHSRSVK